MYIIAHVFSLVLNKDVDARLVNLYPELYQELTTGTALSYKTLSIWIAVLTYQGGIIQGLSQLLTSHGGLRMVSVSFTTLSLDELILVAFEIVT